MAFRAVHVALPSLYHRGFYADFDELIWELTIALDESEFEGPIQFHEFLQAEDPDLYEFIMEIVLAFDRYELERPIRFDEFLGVQDATFYDLIIESMDHAFTFDEHYFERLDRLDELFTEFLEIRGEHYFNEEISELIRLYAMENNANITVWRLWDGIEQYVVHDFNFAPTIISHDSALATGTTDFHNEVSSFRVRVHASLLPLTQTMAIIDSLYLPVLTAVFFLSAVISYFFSRYLAKPIVELNVASKRLGNLDLGGHIKLERTDEIGELSETLSEMAIKLKSSLFELKDANVKLQEEMEREREQERRRRDLFTSISHELKTPITILKGEVGGMIDEVGAYKDRDVYLRSAHGWIQTLEKLVSEVLTISRLEGERVKLNFQEVDVYELVQSVGRDHQELATLKEIALVYEGTSSLMARVDVPQMKMALSNVINNAIFHSKADSEVEISLIHTEAVAVLAVVNKGSRISEEEIPHLFDPFYRVDKSRNRHTGGSGLGLFIVKNILELHGFKYGIANCEEGVVFTIRIPIQVSDQFNGGVTWNS